MRLKDHNAIKGFQQPLVEKKNDDQISRMVKIDIHAKQCMLKITRQSEKCKIKHIEHEL